MRRRSKKREAIYEQRRELVARLLTERPFCEACAIYATLDGRVLRRPRESVDINEIVPRGRGGSILDVSNLLAVCRFPCHRRLTDDTLEGEFCGLVLPGWANDEVALEAANRRDELSRGIVPQITPSWWDDMKRGYWAKHMEEQLDQMRDVSSP